MINKRYHVCKDIVSRLDVYETDDIADAVELAEAENNGLWMSGSIGDKKYIVIDTLTNEIIYTEEPNWEENKIVH